LYWSLTEKSCFKRGWLQNFSTKIFVPQSKKKKVIYTQQGYMGHHFKRICSRTLFSKGSTRQKNWLKAKNINYIHLAQQKNLLDKKLMHHQEEDISSTVSNGWVNSACFKRFRIKCYFKCPKLSRSQGQFEMLLFCVWHITNSIRKFFRK
jgi:hypothetical protein